MFHRGMNDSVQVVEKLCCLRGSLIVPKPCRGKCLGNYA